MILWRVTLRELRAKLDAIELLVGELEQRLSKEEERLGGAGAPPPPKPGVQPTPKSKKPLI